VRHVVLDNSSTHKTPSIQRWLLRHPRLTLHFTPTYSSWLNLVERWFAELTTKWIKRSAHRSVRDLVASIRTWPAECGQAARHDLSRIGRTAGLDPSAPALAPRTSPASLSARHARQAVDKPQGAVSGA
jgi:hypothetical protein